MGQKTKQNKTLRRLLCSTGEKTEEVESRQVLKQLNIVLSHAPAILLLSIYPRQMKIHVYTTACTQRFIAASFIITKRGR